MTKSAIRKDTVHRRMLSSNSRPYPVRRKSNMKRLLLSAFSSTPLSQMYIGENENVVLCFHGHTNSGSALEDVVQECQNNNIFPSDTVFIFLNAPYRYGSEGFEWFSYATDKGADISHLSKDAGSVALMRNSNLDIGEMGRKQLFSVVDDIIRLCGLIPNTTNIFFLGTSQGAATAFTAAAWLLHPDYAKSNFSNFRGAFLHRMAGFYTGFLPDIIDTCSIHVSMDRTKHKDDFHSKWTDRDYDQLKKEALRAFRYPRCPPRLFVALHRSDKVISHYFGEFIQNLARSGSCIQPCPVE